MSAAEAGGAGGEAAGTLRALVVDDEASARALLKEYLADHPDVELVGECANGFEAVKAVVDLAPDLLLLDVEMPKLSGFEVLELLGEGAPAVIFVTAYDQYALRAFEVHAVDYLLKPFARERLAEALARARARIASGEGPLEAVALARTAREGKTGKPWADRVLVREGADIRVIPAEQLDYAEARDDAVLLRAGSAKYLKQQTLAELEASLDPARFVRIHRGVLLNIDRLRKLELYAKDSRVAILADGTRLPVSRAGYARLRELL
jgi:two-component system, LytTR family, response regulator